MVTAINVPRKPGIWPVDIDALSVADFLWSATIDIMLLAEDIAEPPIPANENNPEPQRPAIENEAEPPRPATENDAETSRPANNIEYSRKNSGNTTT